MSDSTSTRLVSTEQFPRSRRDYRRFDRYSWHSTYAKMDLAVVEAIMVGLVAEGYDRSSHSLPTNDDTWEL